MKSNLNKVIVSSLAIFAVLLISCNPAKQYEKEEAAQIQSYLTKNSSLNFELKPSGLYYLEVKAGTGDTVQTSDTVYVKYTGKFLDGTVFDSNVSRADSLIFPAFEGYLIYGFEEGLSYMKVGGKSLLLIPSKLGYGPGGQYPISGYTPLLFDIELVKLKPGPRI